MSYGRGVDECVFDAVLLSCTYMRYEQKKRNYAEYTIQALREQPYSFGKESPSVGYLLVCFKQLR